jgi:hypothetical protein|tara:strand:- start:2175 stop:2540 length:366 start_codon:yes stop_codon:yes gene_type:complete
MKDLTKEEIENIVKESNKDLVGEQYTYIANDVADARKERLRSYDQFVEQAKVLLDQMVEKLRGDHETGNIQKADIDYIINDQLNMRMQDALNYTVSSLEALKGPGIETGSPGMTYPNMYDE